MFFFFFECWFCIKLIIFTKKLFCGVRKVALIFLVALLVVACGGSDKKSEPVAAGAAQPQEKEPAAEAVWSPAPPKGVALTTCSIDTMDLSNPYILYESSSNSYYMVGDGGYMWTSRDMHTWEGPYNVLNQDTASWLGKAPEVFSPEIHKYNGKYYYMATFRRGDCMVTDDAGKQFALQSCATLVSSSITGPYKTIDSNSFLLNEREMAGHPTFCTDEMGVSYMIYNHLAQHNGDGTVQIVRFTDDMGRRMGEAYIMFTASQNNWSRDVAGANGFSPIMEAPFLFYTEKGRMGILFTTTIAGKRALGVAYSSTGHLNGPWVMEPRPLMNDGTGSAMLFRDFDGALVMAVDKDTVIGGVAKRVPRLLKADTEFDNLEIKSYYKF